MPGIGPAYRFEQKQRKRERGREPGGDETARPARSEAAIHAGGGGGDAGLGEHWLQVAEDFSKPI